MVKHMSVVQMQDLLDAMFGVERFLTFDRTGRVEHDGTVGSWTLEEEGLYKVTLTNSEETYLVSPTRKESVMPINEEGVCQAKTAKGCSNAATAVRDGKPVCKTHERAKTIVWKENVQVNSALEQGAMSNPEATKEGVAKMREALESSNTAPKYTAYVLGMKVMHRDSEDEVVKVVFDLIATSSEERTIEEHMTFLKSKYWVSSVHYVFFKNEEEKLYYRRVRSDGLVLEQFNIKAGIEVAIKPQNSCIRCLGTGIYPAPSGFQRIDKWGQLVSICFGCDGTGSASHKNGGK